MTSEHSRLLSTNVKLREGIQVRSGLIISNRVKEVVNRLTKDLEDTRIDGNISDFMVSIESNGETHLQVRLTVEQRDYYLFGYTNNFDVLELEADFGTFPNIRTNLKSQRPIRDITQALTTFIELDDGYNGA